MLEKIISGGQTGADIAGVDAAIALGVPYGGMIPRGRKCEAGTIPDSYTGFEEHTSSDYLARTFYNIKHSDGTVIFNRNKNLTSGTLRTWQAANDSGKPCIVLFLEEPEGMISNAAHLADFIHRNSISVLNVAGPRHSKCPEIYMFAKNCLIECISILRKNKKSV